MNLYNTISFFLIFINISKIIILCYYIYSTAYDDMIRGIKSDLIKLILDQFNFTYIVSISFLAFEDSTT
jgi:hypothetical protein